MADPAVGVATWSMGLEGLGLPVELGGAVLAGADVAGRLVVRAAEDLGPGLHAAAGLAVPAGINRAQGTAAGTSLQLGPDEWLILLAAGDAATVAGRMAEGAGGAAHAIIDAGGRTIGLRLSGAAVEDILAAGCPLPLEAVQFPVGRATRTLFAKAEIVLWRVAADCFHVEVARSLAPYLAGIVRQAMATEAALRAPGRG